MACLTNYTVQCKDVISGNVGCFFFDQAHWQQTGEFKAISPVYADLNEFYSHTLPADRQSTYLERA